MSGVQIIRHSSFMARKSEVLAITLKQVTNHAFCVNKNEFASAKFLSQTVGKKVESKDRFISDSALVPGGRRLSGWQRIQN